MRGEGAEPGGGERLAHLGLPPPEPNGTERSRDGTHGAGSSRWGWGGVSRWGGWGAAGKGQVPPGGCVARPLPPAAGGEEAAARLAPPPRRHRGPGGPVVLWCRRRRGPRTTPPARGVGGPQPDSGSPLPLPPVLLLLGTFAKQTSRREAKGAPGRGRGTPGGEEEEEEAVPPGVSPPLLSPGPRGRRCGGSPGRASAGFFFFGGGCCCCSLSVLW